MHQELEKLYSHIDDIEIAMMTTRRVDGHLQSRAMATQKRAEGADLWFVTLEGAQKLRDLAADPHLNLSYYKDRTREWISISGTAKVTSDRQKIHELYAPDWGAWFPKGRGPAPRNKGRSAHGAHRRKRPRGRISRGEQAAAGDPVRTGEGLGHGLDAGNRRDASREEVVSRGASAHAPAMYFDLTREVCAQSSADTSSSPRRAGFPMTSIAIILPFAIVNRNALTTFPCGAKTTPTAPSTRAGRVSCARWP